MLPDKHPDLERSFPQLGVTDYKITSPENPRYNCIAWAACDQDNFWWPNEYGYWPEGVERSETIDAFIKAYGTVGFSLCDSDGFEPGFEMIALYCDANNTPTHAARLIDEKTWTSKLGQSFDISHTENGLNGDRYGTPKLFLKRKQETDGTN